jgi:hypothetical protein
MLAGTDKRAVGSTVGDRAACVQKRRHDRDKLRGGREAF